MRNIRNIKYVRNLRKMRNMRNKTEPEPLTGVWRELEEFVGEVEEIKEDIDWLQHNMLRTVEEGENEEEATYWLETAQEFVDMVREYLR